MLNFYYFLFNVLTLAIRLRENEFLGEVLPVLWENATALGPDEWHLSGITDNYLRVSVQSPQQLWNQISPVRITAMDTSGIQGRLWA